MSRFAFHRFLVVSALLLAAAVPSFAQGPAGGSLDLSGNVGLTTLNGVDNKKGHPSGGVSAMINLTQVIGIGADYNYDALGSYKPYLITDSEHLQTIGGALRINLLPNRVIVPYVIAGAGGSFLTAQASSSIASESATVKGTYFSGGGGVSLFLGGGFGIRPEFRYERHQYQNQVVGGIYVSGTATDAHPTVAVFYQIGGHHRQRR